MAMPANLWNMPDLGLGLGLRSEHWEHIREQNPKVDFFEIISEGYIGTRGRPLYFLDEIAERYRVLMHGVSMSIGSSDPLDMEYLGLLRDLARRIKAPFVSDHLCWTGILGRNSHDLLPVPLSEKALRHVVSRLKIVQDFMEIPVAMENPSNYVEFSESQMSEVEFLTRMSEDANCALLLDVNNIYVSAFNHGFDPDEYIEKVPVERVLYHHVAGHTHKGTHILDTHSDHVVDKVWQMYERLHERHGGRSTMVEWDDDIPAFEIVHAEVLKAQVYRDRAEARQPGSASPHPASERRRGSEGSERQSGYDGSQRGVGSAQPRRPEPRPPRQAASSPVPAGAVRDNRVRPDGGRASSTIGRDDAVDTDSARNRDAAGRRDSGHHAAPAGAVRESHVRPDTSRASSALSDEALHAGT